MEFWFLFEKIIIKKENKYETYTLEEFKTFLNSQLVKKEKEENLDGEEKKESKAIKLLKKANLL